MAEMTLAKEDTAVGVPAGKAPRKIRAAFRRKQAISRWIIVLIVLGFFLLPLVGLLDFSTRKFNGTRTWSTWGTLFHASELRAAAPDLVDGFWITLLLCLVTVVLTVLLLVPTMTWIRLRVPEAQKLVEFVCLLPLTIPAIVLVVGLAPVYRVIGKVLSTGSIWLCFAYVILALPYAYRAIDSGLSAIDVRTLSEAARSLGCSWGKVMWKIVLPNIKAGVIGASFLTVALVLGEFTVASLLLKNNFAVALGALGNSAGADPKLTAVLSLVSLVLGFVLMFGFSFIGNRGNRRSRGKNGSGGVLATGVRGDLRPVPTPSSAQAL
ncbi:putative spermidine/putrescine transport system permease protein [Nakamurella panacisegetis]|uniref:Putative spermidine/putrescine transport system permease protein n=1 Tax=Nakamurella panacisegetis TaxID=1090615 RepID=A0A1H0JK27_9ACTN|nr:ABC transporter permease subunit [Nakamurella panacisegetis]SDO44076.1 putative spermidine/putrescine transport system permease protein [Nakamurella panacisegetis]